MDEEQLLYNAKEIAKEFRDEIERLRAELAAEREKVAKASKALSYYAEQLCEHSKDYEGCGKLPVEYCGGCRARAVVREIGGGDE